MSSHRRRRPRIRRLAIGLLGCALGLPPAATAKPADFGRPLARKH